jgi:hypothetical protein
MHDGGDDGNSATAPRRPNITERTQRREAYTVIAPDEEKRRSIQQKAKEEEEKLEQYRHEHRIQHLSYVGTVGSGESAASNTSIATPVSDAGRSVLTNRTSKMTPAQKSQYYRTEEKRRQDAENERKKQQQRLKATENEEKEHERKARLDEDRRRKNEAFLSQMSKTSKQSIVSRQAAADVATETMATTSSTTNRTTVSDGIARQVQSDPATVDQLHSAFPEFSRAELAELLCEFDGNVEEVMKILTA